MILRVTAATLATAALAASVLPVPARAWAALLAAAGVASLLAGLDVLLARSARSGEALARAVLTRPMYQTDTGPIPVVDAPLAPVTELHRRRSGRHGSRG